MKYHGEYIDDSLLCPGCQSRPCCCEIYADRGKCRHCREWNCKCVRDEDEKPQAKDENGGPDER